MKVISANAKRKRAEKRIIKKLEQMEGAMGVPVTLVKSMSQLPPRFQEQIDHASSEVRGFYDPTTHQVFLILKNLSNPREAREVYLHEVNGHLSIEDVLGDKVEKATNEIYRSIPIVARRLLIEKYRGQISALAGKQRRSIVVKEYLAHLCEPGIADSIVCRVSSSIRGAIRLLYPSLEWSASELIHLLVLARDEIKSRGPRFTQKHMASRLADYLSQELRRANASKSYSGD